MLRVTVGDEVYLEGDARIVYSEDCGKKQSSKKGETMELKGIYTALVTPFKNGSLDEEGLNV